MRLTGEERREVEFQLRSARRQLERATVARDRARLWRRVEHLERVLADGRVPQDEGSA